VEESRVIAYQGVLHSSDDLWNLVERCIYLDSFPAFSYFFFRLLNITLLAHAFPPDLDPFDTLDAAVAHI
jgi:hypothetical protein